MNCKGRLIIDIPHSDALCFQHMLCHCLDAKPSAELAGMGDAFPVRYAIGSCGESGPVLGSVLCDRYSLLSEVV